MHRWTTTGTVAAALFLLSGCGDDADLMRGATPPSDDAPTAPPGGDVPIPSDDDAPSDQDPPRVPLGQPCALADGPDFCGEGFKCGLVQSSEFIDTDYVLRCVPEGRRSEGTACTTPVDDGQPDSCSAGLGCSFGACMPLCVVDGDCAGGGRCEYPDAEFREAGQCAATGCSALGQTCDFGFGCYVRRGVPVEERETRCLPPAGQRRGQACTGDRACAPGLACTRGVCVDYCDPAAPACDPCQEIARADGAERVGLCVGQAP